MPKRRMTGVVVSAKMTKAVVVRVETIKKHPKYERRYRSHKRYKARVEEALPVREGDRVVIEETRPMSKEISWKVVEKKGL